MKVRLHLFAFVFAMTLSTASAWAFQSSPVANIPFRGANYQQRSHEGHSYSFRPAGQDDESTATDILSVNLYPTAHDQEALTTITGRVRGIAENAKATILPASAAGQAEHYFAAVIPTAHGADFDATRFVLVDNQVVGLFYTRRFYGTSAADGAKDWGAKNAASVEQELLHVDAAHLLASAGGSTSPAPAANSGGLPPGTTQAGTLASAQLVRDTMQGVAGKVAMLGCAKIDDVARFVVAPFSGPPRYRQWQEKWVVRGCGKQYPVDISFKEDGSGGADWTIGK